LGRASTPETGRGGLPIGALSLVIDPATPIDATITDFARGDVIETLLANQGTIVTAAAYTAGSHGNGTLVLSDDGHALNTLTLHGSYAGDQFLTNAAGAGGVTDITIAPTPSSSQLG
jgi:hypothetical protein